MLIQLSLSRSRSIDSYLFICIYLNQSISLPLSISLSICLYSFIHLSLVRLIPNFSPCEDTLPTKRFEIAYNYYLLPIQTCIR